MRRTMIALFVGTSLTLAAPAVAGPAETATFHRLMDDYWAAYLKTSPLSASQAGVQSYDAQLDLVGTAQMNRQAAAAAGFLARLNTIPAAGLDPPRPDQSRDPQAPA